MNRLTIQHYLHKILAWLKKFHILKMSTHSDRDVPGGTLDPNGLRVGLVDKRGSLPDADQEEIYDLPSGFERMKIYVNGEPVSGRWVMVETETGEYAMKYWFSLHLQNGLAKDDSLDS